ncbi:MAG: alpha/beta hydrolase [Methylobacter sp.]|nr:MAG: alpha/beta hydrolase [Methylobacter sp.]
MSLRYVVLIFIFLLGANSCATSADKSTENNFPQATKGHKEHKIRNKGTEQADHADQASSVVVYKTVNAINLKLNVYQPSTSERSKDKQTAIVFFHGGAWSEGAPVQFQRQALYLAQRGIVSITAEYRLQKLHGTTPFEAVADAKSAIRWLRAHAADLRIDPNKIIASGGSAGGQLAVATAVVDGDNDPSDNLTVSATPNALVLFNPVLDMQRWQKKFGVDMQAISPLQQLHKALPPTIIFHGTSDKVAPYPITVKFVNKAQSINSSNVRLVSYDKREHAFYNKDDDENSDFKTTLKQTYDFIMSLGW